MKSTVSERPCEEEIKYPCLMKHKRLGSIYLVTGKNEGFVVSPNGGCDLGDAVSGDIVNAEIFHGSVCLEN